MTGYDKLRIPFTQNINCGVDTLTRGIKQMQTADNTAHPFNTTDTTYMLNRIDQTGVTAAGNNYQPSACFKPHGHVIFN